MSSDPTDNDSMMRRAPPRGNAKLKAGPDFARDQSEAPIEWLLRQTVDPLHRQYLHYLYDPDINKRVKVAAKLIARQMAGRRRRGSDEFEHEADDLIQHALELICRKRPQFESKWAFLADMVKRMQNYDRWRRRSQSAQSRIDDSPGAVDKQHGHESQVLPFPSPEAQASDRQDLERLHRSVREHDSDLEPLLLAIFDGILKPADMCAHLGLEKNELQAQRKRLNQLAVRTLNRKG